ncbi:AAA family ATPase [Streptomyces sp. NBC_00322]|uniref:helix-turn-helix transcriptional regulator n=1 Tax=Streptomyces sp. NBC_00322 TaxID=2975712 RepID=UPI002E2C8593|nr:AAA family ATPase [Streptomyces sp. NBC_00322]
MDRDRETARLCAALDACAHGGSSVVEITGDPGLGKTRLLAELASHARAADLTVLSGRASEYEQERPFGAVVESLRTCLEHAAIRAEPALDEETLSLLDLVMARSSEPVHRTSQLLDVERFRLFGAVSRLFESAGGDGGVLLCLDDLHWADDGTFELLHYLLRNPPAVPIVLACSYRPRQARPRLLACFAQSVDGYRMERLRLAPLDRCAGDLILGTELAAEHRDRLYAASAGNPLYLEVLARLAADSPTTSAQALAQCPSQFVDLPGSLRAALVREVALLNPEQLSVLRAAAVLGDPFDPNLLAAVADLALGPALEALDVLAEMDLVRRGEPSGRMLEFRHPLLRELISGESPPGWWLAAHARADRALREAGAGPVERAPYVARSAEAGDVDAVQLLREAAERTMYSVPATAASWLTAALRLLKSADAGSGEPRLGVLLALARALGLTGDLVGFRAALKEALGMLPSDQRSRWVGVVALQAKVERILGSVSEARAVLEAELAAWPQSSGVANPLRLELATVRMIQRAYDESASYLDTALQHANDTGDRGTRIAAAACRALGAAYNGKTEALRAHASDAAAAVDDMEDGELVAFLDPLSQLGWAELLAERYDNAVRHVTRGIRIARDTGQSHVMPYLLLSHSWAHRAVGQLAEAVGSAEAAEEMAYLLGQSDLLGYSLALRARAIMIREDPVTAAPLAERALRTVRARGRLWCLTAGVLSAIRFEQGRLDDCVSLVQDIIDQPRHSGPTHSIKATYFSTAAQAEAARGRLEAARTWAQRAADAATAVGLRGQLGHAAVAQACLVGHDAQAAVELLGSAVADFASTGQVLVEGRTRLALAQAQASAGQFGAAMENVGQVKQSAVAYGAGHLHVQAVNAQRRIGALRPRARSAATSALSPRESSIAELATQGLSNRDIAEKTFLSVKTVEAHMTRIFRKLGVESRWALTQVFGERQLGGTESRPHERIDGAGRGRGTGGQ